MPDLNIDNERYQALLSDILASRNLEAHLAEVVASIETIDKIIGLAILRQEKTEDYEKLKNELYYLKYEILERL